MSENEEIMNETENETMTAEVEAVETVETEAAEVEAADEVSAEEEAEVVEAAVDYDDEELMDKMQKAARLLRSRRFAISKEEEAKAERMANIERAIKNAMGKDQSDYKEVPYEGYGPHGIAVFVDSLTDNTTRTVADVRSVFNKFNGNLGTQGSLSFLFDHKAVFTFKMKDGMSMDDLILELIDFGVDDEFDEDDEEGEVTIYGDPKSFGDIQHYLEQNGYEITSAEFTRIPNDLKDVTPEQRETIDKMVEKLEEFDDVQNVYTNMKPAED